MPSRCYTFSKATVIGLGGMMPKGVAEVAVKISGK